MSDLDVKIHPVDEDTIALRCPYHPELVPLMRKLNARWNPPLWYLDAEDEETVRSICYEIYGTTGHGMPDLVSVRLHVSEDIEALQGGVFLGGRCIARATGRDSGAKLGPKVVVIEGRPPYSGGSMKNWRTIVPGDSVLEIRKLPLPAAQRLVEAEDDRFFANIVGRKTPDLDALKDRRQELIEELAEVEKMIADNEGAHHG